MLNNVILFSKFVQYKVKEQQKQNIYTPHCLNRFEIKGEQTLRKNIIITININLYCYGNQKSRTVREQKEQKKQNS